MSFPLIFQAIEIDSAVYYDGGIFDNFPRRRNAPTSSPSVTLGFDVSSPDKGRPQPFSTSSTNSSAALKATPYPKAKA